MHADDSVDLPSITHISCSSVFNEFMLDFTLQQKLLMQVIKEYLSNVFRSSCQRCSGATQHFNVVDE